MKPGWQSTEFWVTVLAVVAPIATVFGGVELTENQQLAGSIASVATGIAYIFGRTWYKVKSK